MKRILIILSLVLVFTTVFLSACGSDTENTSSAIENESSEIENESSKADESNAVSLPESGSEGDESSLDGETSNDNESKPDDNTDKPADPDDPDEPDEPDVPDEPNGTYGIEIVAASFTEKPYFALIGTCDEGAVITGTVGNVSVSSQSYKGWFSLRLPCNGASVEVQLTSSVDGVSADGFYTYTATPQTPGSDMWPMVTGGDYQFFLYKMLPDFQGTNIPANYVFSNLTSKVSNRLSELRGYNKNAEIIYMVVPSAMSVYPELVPEEYKPASGDTRLDKTMDALTAGGATVIDLKEVFAEHKNDEMPLYYKLDSHWSDYGAYVAYQALFEHISERFPDAAPRPIEDFNWNPDYYDGGDYAYYLAKDGFQAGKFQKDIREYAYFRTFNVDVPISVRSTPRYRSSTMLCYHDQMTYAKVIRTSNVKLPKCTVLRDSYSTQMYDILAERMSYTNYLGMWDFSWNSYTLSTDKPDYVIYILAEWNLDSVLYN